MTDCTLDLNRTAPRSCRMALALSCMLLLPWCLAPSCSPPDLPDASDPLDQVLADQPQVTPPQGDDPDDNNGTSSIQLRIVASPTAGVAPLSVTLSVTSMTDEPLPDGTYTWDLGDGTVKQGQQISHVFINPGRYVAGVCLALGAGLAPVGCAEKVVQVAAPVVEVPNPPEEPNDPVEPPSPSLLSLTPATDVLMSGPRGGQIAPSSSTFSIRNDGGQPLNWSAAKTQEWLIVAPASGTLAPGAVAQVLASVSAANLAVGIHSDTLTFRNDTTGTQTPVGITLNLTNNVPVAAADGYTTNEDTPLTIAAAQGVLANDTDSDGHTLTATLVTEPAHGSATVNTDGSFTYTPAADYNGPDAFTYKAMDTMSGYATTAVNLTVAAVNDPPVFNTPADQSVSLNATVNVEISGISPGPANEAGQVVTFTATSSDQAVIPNANLVFSGDPASGQVTLACTSTGSGAATITVTGQDNAGAANGGTNTATHSFPLTVFAGVPISGTMSLVQTVGHRPKFGQHGLVFTGTGAWVGHDFSTLTDVDGNYLQAVPEGWTGTIAPEDPSRMFFLDPVTKSGYDTNGQDVSVRVISTPAAMPGLAGQDIVCWTAPIGIPGPEFGIKEGAPTYNPANPLHYFVNNTVLGATDSGNPNGSPTKPRMTIPSALAAGAYVEVHGGPYAYGGGYIQIAGQGTATQPIFIVGKGMPRFNQKISVYHPTDEKRYMIFEGLSLYKWECIAPASYVVLRNCEVRGDLVGGGTAVTSYADPHACHNILIANNLIHDNGDWHAEYDQDILGVAIQQRCRHIWVLDNDLYHNSSDGLQINAGSLQQMPTTHHVYVGRNLSHENKQTGLWTKQAVDVIFSQNHVHSHRPIGTNPSAWGAGMGFQYGPERVWFLYNRIHNCSFGIATHSTSGLGTGQDSYFIGNCIYDIHHDSNYTYLPGTAWSNAGIMIVGTVNKYIVSNTLFDVDAGINSPGAGKVVMANNIIANVSEPQGNHTFLEPGDTATLSSVDNCVFGQHGDLIRIRWINQIHDLQSFQLATGKGSHCLAADPLFIDAENGDFHLQETSPAVGSGLASNVYDTFYALYGIDISTDCDGKRRRHTTQMDVGAYHR